MKKIIGICALCVLLVIPTVVSAAVPQCSVNLETGMVTVTGSTEQGIKNRNVTIRVYDEEDTLAYLDQVKTTDGGDYTVSFSIIDGGGDYRGILSAKDESDAAFTFYLPETQALEEFMQAVAECVEADDAAALAQVLEEYEQAVALTDTEYASLDKTPIAQGFLQIAKENPDDLQSLNQLQAVLKELAVIEAFNQKKTVMEDGVFLHNDILKLENKQEAWELFNNSLKDTAKPLLAESMQGKDFQTAEDVQADFEKQTAVFIIGNHKVNGYGHVKTILDNYAALLGLDLTEYRQLDDRQANQADEKIVQAAPDSAEALQKAIDDAVAAVKDGDDNGQSDGGGRGSGGGGRGPSGNTGNLSIDEELIQGLEQPDQPSAGEEPFRDLENYDWAKEQILLLADRGILNGTAEGIFEPGTPVTREQFVKMLVLACGLPLEGEAAFADVEDSAWYAPYIRAGVENGLIQGISETEFGVGRLIRREDAAVLLYRASSLLGADFVSGESVEFLDQAAISDYAADAVRTLSAAGVIRGNDEGNFEPSASCTRAEAAVMLCRAMEGRS